MRRRGRGESQAANTSLTCSATGSAAQSGRPVSAALAAATGLGGIGKTQLDRPSLWAVVQASPTRRSSASGQCTPALGYVETAAVSPRRRSIRPSAPRRSLSLLMPMNRGWVSAPAAWVLARTESIALLRNHRPELDDATADAIAYKLGDLPLALQLAFSLSIASIPLPRPMPISPPCVGMLAQTHQCPSQESFPCLLPVAVLPPRPGEAVKRVISPEGAGAPARFDEARLRRL
jgi:hypothetical protein